MNTEINPFPKEAHKSEYPAVRQQALMRDCKLNDWLVVVDLMERLSGTLRKNSKLMKYTDQLRHEALCQTLGWSWESVMSSYVNFNDAITEGDCHAITEAGWFADRWLANLMFFDDHYEFKYIIIDEPNGGRREGIGLICRACNIQWVQPGSIILCIIAEYDNINKKWKDAQNPF